MKKTGLSNQTFRNNSFRAGLCLLAGLWRLTALGAAGAPVVSSVEPPNWWRGRSPSEVRLLLHGRNLAGARVAVAGLVTGPPRVNAAGTYAFVSVRVGARTRTGAHAVCVTTPSGRARARFTVSRPLRRRGRFAGFSPDDVIYLIMPDRFSDGDPGNDDPARSRGLYRPARSRYYHGGDLQGVLNHLPYLKQLGVTAVWLTPLYDNADRADTRFHWDGQPAIDYHGYGAVNFYRVEEHFGTLGTLRRLTDAAHRLGIKIIQDQVANHTGPFHPWVADPPTPTWYHGTPAHHLANTWQVPALADPHAAAAARRATLDGWFADVLPDLNQEDPEEARYTIQNTLWWLGVTGLDAIRQDTLSYVPRRFWRRWSAAVHREYPRVTLLGEVNQPDPAVVAFFQGGRAGFDGVDTGIDTLFDYPLFFALRRAFAEGRPVAEVTAALGRDSLYPHPERLVTFLDLHDVARFLSVPGATVPGYKLALTALLTLRGAPMLYYGDEIGMRGGADPDNRRDFPGGFPNATRDAFRRAGRTPEEQDLYAHTRRLLALRRRWAPLRRGALRPLRVTPQQYVYARTTARDAVVVVLNNDTKPARVTFPIAGTPLAGRRVLVERLGPARAWPVHGDRVTVEVPARGAALLTR